MKILLMAWKCINQLKVTIAKYYTPSGRCIQVLNYSHRNADGSVGKVPDSLKHPFKTTNGRTVYTETYYGMATTSWQNRSS
jgi:hypothetical protein